MENLTEREKKLVEFVKVLINCLTMFQMFADNIVANFNWRTNSMKQIGMSIEYQDEMLKFMEEEYGLRYTKIDPTTHKVVDEKLEVGNE